MVQMISTAGSTETGMARWVWGLSWVEVRMGVWVAAGGGGVRLPSFLLAWRRGGSSAHAEKRDARRIKGMRIAWGMDRFLSESSASFTCRVLKLFP
jgi:hypothetical protein